MSSAPPPGSTPAPSSPAPPATTSPPPATSSPPDATTAPPPATPSAPPPATSSTPPPATPSSPPPTNTAPPPATPSPPPLPSTTSPPPANPSPPPPTTASPPPGASSPPATNAPPPSTPARTPPRTPSPPDGPPSPPTDSGPPPPPETPSNPSSPPQSSTPSAPSGGSPPPQRSPGLTPAGGNPPPSPPGRSGTPLTPAARIPPPSQEGDSGGGGGVAVGVVVGAVAAGVAVLVALTLVFMFCWRKKKRRGDDEAGYLTPPPPGPKDGPHSGQPQHYWQQSNLPPPDPALARKHYLPSQSTSSQPISSSSGGGYSGAGDNAIPPSSPELMLGLSRNATFTYEDLARATNGFSDANLLGQGGFGYVHKGVLPNGKEVAVKQLKAGSGQGEREFQAEVEIISRVHHRHLVSLVGYCIVGDQRMLVYEFVPNNTLQFHLHGKDRPTMDWSTRLKIALGAARGLAYLHEDCYPKIIHRDIKAANILLDLKFEAKVADFGLAKLASDSDTHVSTRVMGTFGYLAPEYAQSGKLTEKSDVFSFGVVLLELITGRKPLDTSGAVMEESLVDWARPLLTRAMEDGNFDALVDPNLNEEYDHDEMARMVACAAASVRHSSRRRPKMSQVVRALEGDMSISNLSEGVKPGHSTVYSSDTTEYNSGKYNEDLRKFRRMALDSQGYGGSNEYSGPSSDYGVYPSGSSSEGQTTREMDSRTMKGRSQGFIRGS